MARFSVATDHAFKNRSGEAVIETTWHQVTAFKSDRMPDFSALVKGAGVEVKGRLRNNRFTDSNGIDTINSLFIEMNKPRQSCDG